MTYLVTHQQVVDAVRSVPDGQCEDTGLYVERCSGDLAVLNHQVLGGKQAGEVTFDFCGVHRSLALMHIVYTKKGCPKAPLDRFCNCLLNDREVLDLLTHEGSIELTFQTLLVTDNKHVCVVVEVPKNPS